jgi:hypothetical protein
VHPVLRQIALLFRGRRFTSANVALLREIALVAGVVLTLEILVFAAFFSGAQIPQFDFVSGYNTEAFAWWRDGSFFAPPQWMPYLWGGYPSVSNLQNSSFYLPVGIVAAFVPFTLHASAAMSALHVAFGAVGIYVFARRWGIASPAALIGLIAWFFAAGIYSNATQPDIARAYAWLPWILLITSVKWPWRNSFAVVVAVLFIWQAILGIYPGIVVAFAYTVPFWILANQLLSRPKFRRFLLPLIVAGIAAALMTLLRFLPALIERGHSGALSLDQSSANLAILGTVLYPYDNPLLPGPEVMRSFFLPALLVPLVVFIPWRNRLVRALVIPVILAIVVGLPVWPWHDLVTQFLPGMELSRFRMSDFKPMILFGVTASAIVALDSLLRGVVERAAEEPDARPNRQDSGGRVGLIRIAALVGINLLFAAIGIRYHFDTVGSLPQWMLLAGSSVILVIISERRNLGGLRLILLSLGLIVAVSGVLGAFAVPQSWYYDRVQVEANYLGAPINTLIAERAAAKPTAQRPARAPVPEDRSNPAQIYWIFGSAFYSGHSAVFGYVNLKGTEVYDRIKSQIYSPGSLGRDAAAFWSAAGMVSQGSPDTVPSASSGELCASTGECGTNLTTVPISYSPTGAFSYRLGASADVDVILNEAGYSGWHATLCPADKSSDCRVVATRAGAGGELSLSIPQGVWRLDLEYRLPGLTTAWALFAVGVFLTLALAVVTTLAGPPRTRVTAVPEKTVGSAQDRDGDVSANAFRQLNSRDALTEHTTNVSQPNSTSSELSASPVTSNTTSTSAGQA